MKIVLVTGSAGLVGSESVQPSHDWAARDPYTDFTVNANGTLTLLENTGQICPDAVFIFCSTNKVYGDRWVYNLPLWSGLQSMLPLSFLIGNEHPTRRVFSPDLNDRG